MVRPGRHRHRHHPARSLGLPQRSRGAPAAQRHHRFHRRLERLRFRRRARARAAHPRRHRPAQDQRRRFVALQPRRVDQRADRRQRVFLAGDVRANEQVGLTAMHTLFVREHNYWAGEIAAEDPALDDEAIYQRARAIVAAEMQAITYREFLPALLGRRTLAPYRGYRPDVDPGIANVFATAAYRFGHSMLSPELQRLDAGGRVIAAGNLALANAFFNPEEIAAQGIDPLLRGLATQRAQEIDNFLVDAVRNFLFGPPGAGGFDLASLNIQRGRDHGLPGYNQVRADYGLRRVRNFAEINRDPVVQANLAAVYPSVDDVDVWVGGLAERHRPGALVGETWQRILAEQFERLRDGDRFWYESYLPADLVRVVERQTLARIIRRNTAIGGELQADVFRVPSSAP
ncbi:MAG: hypothetical protein HC897_13140 [Thermoanaerobaculia bacterium]|nr:hypothetical protein [Thermoanaerobaculia bacterium]